MPDCCDRKFEELEWLVHQLGVCLEELKIGWDCPLQEVTDGLQSAVEAATD